MRLKLLNRIASTTAFLMIASFMLSSLISEFIGNHVLIATVKRSIFCSLSLLIICMILTAVSTKKLASLHPNIPYYLISVKRIKLISLNGVIFLAPLATVLFITILRTNLWFNKHFLIYKNVYRPKK
jgi:predicted neutral ceramidase superfamily lipid hydrolase